MKKLYFWAGILLCTAVSACQENEMKGYSGTDALYFQADASSWSSKSDSVVYSFAGKENTVYTVNLLVNLQGNPTGHDRAVKVAVDPARTTAQEGLHYSPLQAEYTLPAGQMQMTIPVELRNSDPALEEKSVQLALELLPTDELQLGLTGRTHIRIIVSNILTKPSYWDVYRMDYYLGPYSRTLHESYIRILGKDFPATVEEMMPVFEDWQQYGAYMDQYFTEHYPVYDENGNIIEPWR